MYEVSSADQVLADGICDQHRGPSLCCMAAIWKLLLWMLCLPHVEQP